MPLTFLDRHGFSRQAYYPYSRYAATDVHKSALHSYISECVADDPWKLLVAEMLLNKTAGRVAVPVFSTSMEL